ncbi:MAG: hypothetical protein ABIS01_01870, partial [Ferruginibacter sp.]
SGSRSSFQQLKGSPVIPNFLRSFFVEYNVFYQVDQCCERGLVDISSFMETITELPLIIF